MKSTTLIILIGVTAAVGVGAALVSMQGRATVKSEVATKELFPDLGAKVNTIELVSVKTKDKEYTFKRTEAGWEASDKGGYPVKGEKIGEVVRGLSQLRMVEEKTSRPENYSKIGVEDPANSKPPAEGEQPSSATLLTLKDGQGQTVTSVILGNTKWDSKPQMYLRKAGEAQSYLANSRIELPSAFSQWVDAQVPGVPKERIKAAEITFPDGTKTRVTKEKKADANFTVHDIPQGEELSMPASGDTVGNALSGLTFEDVAPASELFPPPPPAAGNEAVKPGPSATFETFDGMKVLMQSVMKDGKFWAHFVAEFLEQPAAEPPPAPPPPPPGQPAPPAEKKPEEVQKEVMDFNAKTAKWAFQLPDWKAGNFKTTVGAMLKSKPPVAPPTINQGNDAAGMNPLPLPGGPGVPPQSNPTNPAPSPETPPQPKPETPPQPAPETPPQPAPTGGI